MSLELVKGNGLADAARFFVLVHVVLGGGLAAASFNGVWL